MSASIWIINYISRNYDWDNRRTSDEHIEEDEGFFTSEAAAQQRVDELNASTVRLWESEQERKRQAYAVQLAVWEEQQRQLEFLTANGFAPPAGGPKPKEPRLTAYEDWLWSEGGKGTHEALELKPVEVKQT